MRLGIFARTFSRPDLACTLDAVTDYGFSLVHLGMLSAGLDAMPNDISDAKIDEVRWATHARGVTVASLSGTFNMIHPDSSIVSDGLARLAVLAASARPIGAELITLCTGSRDADSMWRRHPGNDAPEAWDDLLGAMSTALVSADRYDVTLGIEPEPGNVVNSAEKCRRLLDYFDSARLKVAFDPANLISTNLARDRSELLDEAFALLGPDIIVVHGKDCDRNGRVAPAGQGVVPWRLVVDRLRECNGNDQIPLVIHGLEESDVPAARQFFERLTGAD